MKNLNKYILEKFRISKNIKVKSDSDKQIRSLPEKSFIFYDRKGGFHTLTLYNRDMTDDEFIKYLTKEWGPLNDIRIKKDSIKIFDTEEEIDQYRQKLCDEKYGK